MFIQIINYLHNAISKSTNILIIPVVFMVLLLFFRFIKNFQSLQKIAQGEQSLGKNSKNSKLNAFSVMMSCVGGALGIGNIIAGCMAVKYFGPGVLFWILTLSLIISGAKFFEVKTSCSPNHISKLGPISYIGQSLKSISPRLDIFRTLFVCMFVIGYILIAAMQSNQLIDVIQVGFYYKLAISILVGVATLFFLTNNMKEISIFSAVVVPAMILIQLYVCFVIVYQSEKSSVDVARIILKDAFTSKTAPIYAIIIYAMQRMILATDVGTGISGLLSADSKIKQNFRQGFLSALEPFFVGIVVTIVGFAIVAGDLVDKNIPTGVASFTSKIQSKTDMFLFGFSIFMFAITTIVTRGYAVMKVVLSMTNKKTTALKWITIAVISIFISVSFLLDLEKIVFFADLAIIIASLINLTSLTLITNKSAIKS